MNIRDYRPEEDKEQVKILCEKYGWGFPTEGKIIVAETNGEIKSFINMRLVTFVEPFVSESPIIGKKLWEYVEDRIKEKKIPIVRCFTKIKNKSLFEKLGFYEVFKEEYVSLEKNYYKRGIE